MKPTDIPPLAIADFLFNCVLLLIYPIMFVCYYRLRKAHIESDKKIADALEHYHANNPTGTYIAETHIGTKDKFVIINGRGFLVEHASSVVKQKETH